MLAKGIGVDSQQQRVVAAASIIRQLMSGSVQLLDDGTPVAVMPVDYHVSPMTIEKLTASVSMNYATALALQRKAGGDLSFEPYAIALAMIITEFARAVGTDAHFVLLNAEAASTWTQSPENAGRIQAFRDWSLARRGATGQPDNSQ